MSWTLFSARRSYRQDRIFSIFLIIARCWFVFSLYFWTVRTLNFQVIIGIHFLSVYNIWGYRLFRYLKMQIQQFGKVNTRLTSYFYFTTECLQRIRSSIPFMIVNHDIFHWFSYALYAIKLKRLKWAQNTWVPRCFCPVSGVPAPSFGKPKHVI